MMISVFGDMRLDKRLNQLTEALNDVPVVNLPQALCNASSLKAGYRFMNNERVTHQGIIEIERQQTLQRIEADRGSILLAVQDTTAFNFAKRAALEGVGVLEDNRTPGFFAHTTLAVSDQGVPLGVLAQQVWSRPQNLERDKEAHKHKPITEKESFKWLQGLRAVPESPHHRIVTVCDREADIYELFQDAKDHQRDFIVRVVRNRRLEDLTALYDHLADVTVADTYTITVQKQQNQAERVAQVALRYTTVTLLPPKNRPGAAQAFPLEPLTVQLVEVREVGVTETVKNPLHWVLMTTLVVDSADDAHRIVRFYTYRWLVERFHYVLKSGGCNFEESQLRTVEALHRLLGLCSRVAWRLLWLTYQARETPDADCTVALSTVEWQALMAFTSRSPTPPAAPPTLREAVRTIAKLGGFIGRTSDGEPGVKVLWRGWQRLQDIVATWMIFQPSEVVGND
jgi:hypothetical protein